MRNSAQNSLTIPSDDKRTMHRNISILNVINMDIIQHPTHKSPGLFSIACLVWLNIRCPLF